VGTEYTNANHYKIEKYKIFEKGHCSILKPFPSKERDHFLSPQPANNLHWSSASCGVPLTA